MSYLNKARKLLSQVLNSADIRDSCGHGLQHANKVVEHAQKAIEYERLSTDIIEAILLASLLHDADDYKFFPTNHNYENARWILKELGVQQELVIEMISLVSCSKNKNNVVKPDWKLIPRYADRLEALGKIGIVRCWQYTKHTNRPLYLSSTVQPTIENLPVIASTQRFENYFGNSVSMIDHFYDKLLHLHQIPIDNKYLQEETQRRHEVMVKFCLQFGITGTIDEHQIQEWEAELLT